MAEVLTVRSTGERAPAEKTRDANAPATAARETETAHARAPPGGHELFAATARRDALARMLASPGRPLDPTTRGFFEPRLHASLADVRVHADESAAEAADALAASAFALGSKIGFARGRYAPATARGRRLLAHELAHVLQMRGQPVSLAPASDPAWEDGAERAAGDVVAGREHPPVRGAPAAVRRQPVAAPADPAAEEQARHDARIQAKLEEYSDFEADAPTARDEAYWKRAMLLLAHASPRRFLDDRDFEGHVERIEEIAATEAETYRVVGEPVFRDWPRAFPELWSERVYKALHLALDIDKLKQDAADEFAAVERVGERVPPYLLEHGLPTTLNQARALRRFSLGLSHARMTSPHIAKEFTRTVFGYMGAASNATFFVVWEKIATEVRDSVAEGEQIVTWTEYEQFRADQGQILRGLPDRLRTTPWDDESLRVLEKDVLRLGDAVFLQAFASSLVGLVSLLDYWKRGAAVFDARKREAGVEIARADWDNLGRALTWAYEKGYFGDRGAEIWQAIKQNAWSIVVMAAGFIVVQFIPVLNVAVDVAIIVYSGIDALDAILSLKDAFVHVRDADSVESLERAAAELADKLVGDGLRVLMDVIAIAAGVAGIGAKLGQVKAANPRISDQEAVKQALREAGARERALVAGARAAEDFLARNGRSAVARLALERAAGNVQHAEVILKALRGMKLTPEEAALLKRIAPDLAPKAPPPGAKAPSPEAQKPKLEPVKGAEEIKMASLEEYARRIGHVFPAHSFDVVKSLLEEVGNRAAAALVKDADFVAACRAGNWKLAGTLFHAEAAAQGRALAANLPPGYRARFEYVVQPGKGGSRLDVFVEDPGGLYIEVDWKTTGRSALSYGSRTEMARHAAQTAANAGAIPAEQLSKSWVDFVRPLLPGVKWP